MATYRKGGAALRSILAFGGGFAGSDEAYKGFLQAYERTTGRPGRFIASRRKGQPNTPLWGKPVVEPFIFQAAHFIDEIRAIMEESDQPVELHLGSHSFGVPVTAFAAARLLSGKAFPPHLNKQLRIASFTGLCPGGVYKEPTLLLEARIAAMAVHDVFTSSEGREYWRNSGDYLFGDIKRSLREGACIANHPVTPHLLSVLRDFGIEAKIFLAPDDNAFSHGKTRAVLAPIVPCFDMERGTGHNPQFAPRRTLRALHERGALYV